MLKIANSLKNNIVYKFFLNLTLDSRVVFWGRHASFTLLKMMSAHSIAWLSHKIVVKDTQAIYFL